MKTAKRSAKVATKATSKSKPTPKPTRAPKGGCWANGRFYRGGQWLPAVVETLARLTDEDRFQAALAEVGKGEAYAMAMAHYLARGAKTPARLIAIIDGVAHNAYELLAKRAPTERERIKWSLRAQERAGYVYAATFSGRA